jgi:hypothetical protein
MSAAIYLALSALYPPKPLPTQTKTSQRSDYYYLPTEQKEFVNVGEDM